MSDKMNSPKVPAQQEFKGHHKIMELFVIPEYKASSRSLKTKTKLRGFGPRANYTDRATAACWQS
jgi:hypothetical protein